MIKQEQINDLVAELKSHTLSSLRNHQKDIVPYIITCKDQFPTADLTWKESYSRIAPVRKYHYKDTNFMYRYSDDYPEETIGILRVEGMVFKNFAWKTDKISFISTIEALAWKHYMQPFLLFINNKVVNWNDIDVIYDAGECFLLLHGEKYNYIYLEECDFKIVTLPFNVEYAGTESDDIFDTYLESFIGYITDSVSVRDGDIFINVPSLECTYTRRGALYPIGEWYYRQVKMYALGLLSEARSKRLKSIMIYTKVYDKVRDETVTVYNRFNALDRDSYDKTMFEYIYHRYLDEDLLFAFDNDGLFDINGDNKWYVLSDRIYHSHLCSYDEYVYSNHNDIENILQRENYIVFKNGLLDIDCELSYGLNNLMMIKNTPLDRVDVVTIYHKDLTPVWQSGNLKFNRAYLNAKAADYFNVNRKVQNGIQAILMDDEYNLTDRIIYRLDAALQDLYLGWNHRDVMLINSKDKRFEIFAMLMNSIDEFNGKIWKNIKTIDDTYCNDIEMLNSEYRKLYAILMEENDRFDGLVLSEAFYLIDVANDKNLELLRGSMYAKLEDGTIIPLNEYLSYSDPSMYNENIAIINRDYANITAYILNDSGDYTGDTIVFTDDFIPVLHSEEPIEFINHSNEVMAFTMNDDGTFTGKIIHDVLSYDKASEDYGMMLDGVVFLNYGDGEIKDYVYECMKYLDYEFSNDIPYEENVDMAIRSIIDYDVSIFNRLNHTTIHTITMTGREVNERLYDPGMNGINSALRINRDLIDKHESFCLVFLNGELIESYSRMINKTNYFILPLDPIGTYDTLEIMYFDYIDNNEIHFNMTDGIKENLITINEDGENVISIYGNVILNKTMRIFERYPANILEYRSVISDDRDIAFNVSYINSKNQICMMDVLDNTDDEFIAVSTRKFVYERLYVKDKSYRIRMSKRFRYCDNIKQYMLFINGRRINEDSYFVTIPKYTRPFDGIWLYTTKYVTANDRVEIFYLPEEMYNDNTNNDIRLSEDGYIEVDKTKIDVPLDNRLYAFFINGKKIPSTDIETINSYMLRLKKDTKTLMPLVVNKLYKDSMSEVSDYMHDRDRYCVYDNMIEKIRRSIYLGKAELNNLFNIYTTMSNIESNKLSKSIGRIAIINEIVRDFWVRSGFNYNEPGYVYDYDIDEITSYDKDGNIVLPAMDATNDYNVIKNDTHLLYFYPDNDEYLIEEGSSIDSINFIWDYSLGNPHDSDIPLTILYQNINGVNIDPNARSYAWTNPISNTTKFLLTANTGYQLLEMPYLLKFVLPVFYGRINQDSLENYRLSDLMSIEDLIALIPKRGSLYLPSEKEMEIHQITPDIIQDLKRDYYIWRDLSWVNKADIIDSEYISDLIAILPNEYDELFDLHLWKDLTERGMEYTLERYKHLTFDGLLLVDPHEDPIEWIHWLKAILPADNDPMDYPDRLIPPDGTVLLDDRIDSIMAILLREDGKLSTKKWWHLFSIDEEDQDWMFFEWLNTDMDNIGYLRSTVERAEIPEGIEPLLRGAPKPVLSDDLVTDLTFVNTRKDIIGDLGFFTIADWGQYYFITEELLALILNEDGSISDKYYNDITYKNTNKDKIYAMGYIKDRWGLPRTKFLDEEGMQALIMDDDGNFTGKKIPIDVGSDYVWDGVYAEDIEPAQYTFDDEDDTDSVELEQSDNPGYHINMSDSTLNVINPDGSITEGADTFDGLIAYIYDDNGEFYHEIYDDPYNAIGHVLDEAGIETGETISMKDIMVMLIDENDKVTAIIYLNDDSIFALTMAEDGSFNIDKTKIEDHNINISLNSKDYNVYALAIDESLNVDRSIIEDVINMNMKNTSNLPIDSNIMALLMDDAGNFTGTRFYDIFNSQSDTPTPEEKVDRIVDLTDNDYLLKDNDDSIGLFFINDLSTIITGNDILMSGSMERESGSIDDVISKYISEYVSADDEFIFIDNSVDNIYLLHENDKGLIDILDSGVNPKDITAVYKINDDYIFIDNDHIPFDWLKSLYAITDGANISNISESMVDDIDNSYSKILAILDNGNRVELNMLDDTTLFVDEPSKSDIHNYFSDEDIVFIDDITDPDDIILFDPYTNYHRYTSEKDLSHLMVHLEKHLQESAEMDIRYPIGNNNYWVYAVPEKYAYNYDRSKKFDFYMQDLKDPDLLDHANNNYSMPLYGTYKDNRLERLDEIKMEYLGETEYTNEYGIKTNYILYRTNGFFNRIYDDYGIHIKVQNRVS